MHLTLILIITFIAAFLSVRFLARYFIKKGLMDIPNARSSHDVPTPRGGGLGLLLAIGIGVGVAAILGQALPGWKLGVAALIIAIVGLIDDKKPLPVYIRLGIQLLVAGWVYYQTGGFQKFPLPEPANFELAWLTIPFNLVWILGVMNIFNFLDGIDGFAGVQSLIAGLGIAFLGYGTPVFIPGLVIACAALGFLFLNWHPASIFMGDTGSSTLGFLFACLPFYFANTGSYIGTYLMVLLLWFFLADGAFTLIRRAIKGEKIWEAHRSHLYQRLVISGMTHAQVVLTVMSAGIILTGFTLFCWTRNFSLWYPLIVALFLFGIYWTFTTVQEQKTTVKAS